MQLGRDKSFSAVVQRNGHQKESGVHQNEGAVSDAVVVKVEPPLCVVYGVGPRRRFKGEIHLAVVDFLSEEEQMKAEKEKDGEGWLPTQAEQPDWNTGR